MGSSLRSVGRTRRRSAAVVVLVAALAACSDGGRTTASTNEVPTTSSTNEVHTTSSSTSSTSSTSIRRNPDAAARRYLVESTRSRLAAASWYKWYTNLAEALPNARYHAGDKEPVPVTELLVLGEIIDVTEGVGFWPAGKPDSATDVRQVDFDDERAMWRTLHLTVRVDREVDSDGGPKVDEVRVVWTIDGRAYGRGDGDEQLPTIKTALRELGPVVMLLQHNATADYGPNLLAIVEGGALLATVADDGSISFPFMDPGEDETFRDGIRTVEDLFSEARKPATVQSVPG